MSGHPSTIVLTGPDVLALLLMVYAVCLVVRRILGALISWCRDVAQLRHERRVELAHARYRHDYPPLPSRLAAGPPGGFFLGRPHGCSADDVPAAVVAAPPGSRLVTGPPGPCRHEKIVPIIDGTGELHRWACANVPRCDATFDKSIAIYQPAEEK